MTVATRITSVPQVDNIDTISIEIIREGVSVAGYGVIEHSKLTTAQKAVVNAFITLMTTKVATNV